MEELEGCKQKHVDTIELQIPPPTFITSDEQCREGVIIYCSTTWIYN